jgi:SAM-dependent methyltransferase
MGGMQDQERGEHSGRDERPATGEKQVTRSRPAHHAPEYGAWFQDPLIVAVYDRRPPYPEAAIRRLMALAGGAGGAGEGGAGTGAVLDLGAGTGDVARRLAPWVGRVDAVALSAGMIEKGRGLPGGARANLRWIQAAAETAPLAPPYRLATAGESLHWMDWEVVLPRVGAALEPGAALAIVSRTWGDVPALRERLAPIYARYSPVKDYRPYDLIAELEARGLFTPAGRERCGPEGWTPTVDEFMECSYSQRGTSRTHMGPEATAGYDVDVRRVLADLVAEGAIGERGGRLQLQVRATVTWGTPGTGGTARPR